MHVHFLFCERFIMKTGKLDITVDGALSEWGSALENTLRKLESCVMAWHEAGAAKTRCIRFVESEPPPEVPEKEDIIRLDSQ